MLTHISPARPLESLLFVEPLAIGTSGGLATRIALLEILERIIDLGMKVCQQWLGMLGIEGVVVFQWSVTLSLRYGVLFRERSKGIDRHMPRRLLVPY